jgi:hypothetical protein
MSARSVSGAGARLPLDNQTQFKATSPDLHREDAGESQVSGVRIVLFFRDGTRQLERNANPCIDEIHAIDQGF